MERVQADEDANGLAVKIGKQDSSGFRDQEVEAGIAERAGSQWDIRSYGQMESDVGGHGRGIQRVAVVGACQSGNKASVIGCL